MKTKPYTKSGYFFLREEEPEDELILCARCDLCEVPAESLAVSPSVFPFQGWSVDDEETGISMAHPTVWTGRPSLI